MRISTLSLMLTLAALTACGPRDPGTYCAPTEMTAKVEALARDLERAHQAKRIGAPERNQAAERLTAAGLDFAKTEDSRRYCEIMDEIRRDLRLDQPAPSP